MKKELKHSGLTLTELLVVIAVMAILMGIAVPAVKQVMASFDSGTGVRRLVNAALSSARAIAIREQTYAGIRFQQDLTGNAYMVFIVHDPNSTGLANGFKAVEGRKPMKLPEKVGMMTNVFSLLQPDAANDALIDTLAELGNANTFSIVFSSAGKLVNHPVRVRNNTGLSDGLPDGNADPCNDIVFNTKDNVVAGIAQFCQDDYPNPYIASTVDLGLSEEQSVQNFSIYDKAEFNAVTENRRFTNFFKKRLELEYVSPYTGELVMEYREQTQ